MGSSVHIMFRLLVHLFLLLPGITFAQDWSLVPKWADFGLYGPLGFKDLEFKLEFMMDNYEIVSLEKCSRDNGDPTGVTEQHFVNLTLQMRALKPESNTKILNYWAVTFSQLNCYEAAEDLQERPELWLRDELGYVVYSDSKGNSYYDFRIPEARELWIKAAVDPVIKTNGGANGVFLDGVGRKAMTNCRFKTCGEDQASCCEFSAEAEDAFNEGILQAVAAMRDRIHELNEDNIFIGNGLMNYDFNAGNGNPTYETFVDLLDGFCMEHVMGFEGVNMKAEGPPFIKLEDLENLIQLRNTLVEMSKYVLVRSFPGPTGSPIINVGGLSTPQLPDNYPYPKPNNNLEVQQAMKDLFKFPLAVYLCAFAGEKVFYTYSVWYDVRQSVPCLRDHEECQFPHDWDQFVKMNPGPPLEEPNWDGTLCTRRFTHFGISVDLQDENSATWVSGEIQQA